MVRSEDGMMVRFVVKMGWVVKEFEKMMRFLHEDIIVQKTLLTWLGWVGMRGEKIWKWVGYQQFIHQLPECSTLYMLFGRCDGFMR